MVRSSISTLYTFHSRGVECFVDCLHSALVIYAPEYTFYPVLRQLEPTDSTSIVIAIRFRWMYYSSLVKVLSPHLTLFTSLRCTNKPIYTLLLLPLTLSLSLALSFGISTLVYSRSVSMAYPPNRLFCVSISEFWFFFSLHLEGWGARARGQHLLQPFIRHQDNIFESNVR